ncbi:MAG: Glu/Leu/Phe/Val dehydrogenase [Candidatus Bathyarchaeia archaeon]
MLNNVQLSDKEIGMLNLMFDFLVEKPELAGKIDRCSTPYYAFIESYSEDTGLPQPDVWKMFEELERKMVGAESIQVEAPRPLNKWYEISPDEIKMIRVLIDYFSPSPKMAPVGGSRGSLLDSTIETYKWFFGTTEGNGEHAKEQFRNLMEKTQTASSIKVETLAPIIVSPNPYKAVLELLQIAGEKLKLEQGIHEMLKRPMRTIILNIPVVMDDGKVKVFTGYRVQYNDALGPTKGGIRYHPELTLDEVTALSAWMTWKTAVAGLPLGGGKGGVRCNPKEMSTTELERLTRGYTRALARYIGPYSDVPAPDVYTDSQTMAWIMDEYSQIVGCNTFGVVTGKPVCLGGSLGRSEATSRGLMYAVIEAAKHLGIELTGARVAVQGFGNVGYNAARLLDELGCKVIAVSDSKGGIYNPEGLNPKLVNAHKNETGSVVGYANSKSVSNEEILELSCEVLVPAALENQITEANADKVQARIVAEGANGPTTPMADEILFRKGIFTIPDILANSGGVIVSYFEQVQNQMNYYWSEDEVRRKLENQIVTAFNGVLAVAEEHKVNMRVAAYMKALKRVADAMIVRKQNSFVPVASK